MECTESGIQDAFSRSLSREVVEGETKGTEEATVLAELGVQEGVPVTSNSSVLVTC